VLLATIAEVINSYSCGNIDSSHWHQSEGQNTRSGHSANSGRVIKHQELKVREKGPMISVVVPIYNEEETIVALHTAMQEAMNSTGEDWEVVYVNDGSRDNSLALLMQQQALDPHVVVVNLSRNWGHQGAITAGLATAKGDAIVTMDGDLQDHPCEIPRMIEAWKRGAQVVLCERAKRDDKGLKAMMYPIFYKVLGKLADFPIPLNSGIFGLIDRKVCDQLNNLPEKNRYIPGLKTFVGYRTETIYYHRRARHAGEPKYTWRKLFRYAFDAICSFSYKPLRLATVSGAALLLFTLTAALMLIAGTASASVRGALWFAPAAIVDGLLFVAGLQLCCMGFMGEYIGRIYDEVRQRPLFVIDNVLRSPVNVYDISAYKQPVAEFELPIAPALVAQQNGKTDTAVPLPTLVPAPSAA
jgi:glycosyltransferase involved in cell wall biosynthesis